MRQREDGGTGDRGVLSELMRTGSVQMSLLAPYRPKVFVSYHHEAHRAHYEAFSRFFGGDLKLVTDNSLRRVIDSSVHDYVMRSIREDHIGGTSCTIVLCGDSTWGRKYCDWEILATLNKKHSLLGIAMPGLSYSLLEGFRLPDRLQDNLDSGFARMVTWSELSSSPSHLTFILRELADRPRSLIRNDRPPRERDHNVSLLG